VEQAAAEAREMYAFMYRGSAFANMPRSREFLGRWLDETGGTRTLTAEEIASLLSDSTARRRIGQRLAEKPRPDICFLNGESLSQITASDGTDWFRALGWFQVEFTGEYRRQGDRIFLKGKFKVSDLYDWQNPGEKSVNIRGDTIYDKWATLVEDHGMAREFTIEGESHLELKVPVSSPSHTPR
jgi:hypothetical protein